MTGIGSQRSTTRSAELFERAQGHLAGGVGSGTRSPKSGWLPAADLRAAGRAART